MDHHRNPLFKYPHSEFLRIQRVSTYIFLTSLIIIVFLDVFIQNIQIIFTSYLFTMYVANRSFWEHMRHKHPNKLTRFMYGGQTNFRIAFSLCVLQLYLLYNCRTVSEQSYMTSEITLTKHEENSL